MSPGLRTRPAPLRLAWLLGHAPGFLQEPARRALLGRRRGDSSARLLFAWLLRLAWLCVHAPGFMQAPARLALLGRRRGDSSARLLSDWVRCQIGLRMQGVGVGLRTGWRAEIHQRRGFRGADGSCEARHVGLSCLHGILYAAPRAFSHARARLPKERGQGEIH